MNIPIGYVTYWYRDEADAKAGNSYARSFMWSESVAVDHYGKTMFEAYGQKVHLLGKEGTSYWFKVVPLFSDELRQEHEEYQNRMRQVSREGME